MNVLGLISQLIGIETLRLTTLFEIVRFVSKYVMGDKYCNIEI